MYNLLFIACMLPSCCCDDQPHCTVCTRPCSQPPPPHAVALTVHTLTLLYSKYSVQTNTYMGGVKEYT